MELDTLVICHRRKLVSQIKDTLNKFLLNFSFSNHPVPLSKEGSTSFPKPFSPQGTRDVTALRCSEPLRYKVGGPIKGLARLCGLGPPGVEWGQACWDRLAKGGDCYTA